MENRRARVDTLITMKIKTSLPDVIAGKETIPFSVPLSYTWMEIFEMHNVSFDPSKHVLKGKGIELDCQSKIINFFELYSKNLDTYLVNIVERSHRKSGRYPIIGNNSAIDLQKKKRCISRVYGRYHPYMMQNMNKMPTTSVSPCMLVEGSSKHGLSLRSACRRAGARVIVNHNVESAVVPVVPPMPVIQATKAAREVGGNGPAQPSTSEEMRTSVPAAASDGLSFNFHPTEIHQVPCTKSSEISSTVSPMTPNMTPPMTPMNSSILAHSTVQATRIPAKQVMVQPAAPQTEQPSQRISEPQASVAFQIPSAPRSTPFLPPPTPNPFLFRDETTETGNILKPHETYVKERVLNYLRDHLSNRDFLESITELTLLKKQEKFTKLSRLVPFTACFLQASLLDPTSSIDCSDENNAKNGSN